LVTIEAFFQEVKQTVYEGENVSIRGFGTFTTQLIKAKNPET
jgi:nucleoid DNA-binding protein